MDNKPYSGNAKFVQIDNLRSKAMPLEEVVGGKKLFVVPIFNLDRFPMYDAPKEIVRHYITVRPNRYKLYQSEPLDINVMQPNGALKWEKFYSWTYTKEIVEDGTHENGEIKFKTVYNWFEGSQVPQEDLPESKITEEQEKHEEVEPEESKEIKVEAEKLDSEKDPMAEYSVFEDGDDGNPGISYPQTFKLCKKEIEKRLGKEGLDNVIAIEKKKFGVERKKGFFHVSDLPEVVNDLWEIIKANPKQE